MAATRLRLLVACATIVLLALSLRASSPKFFLAATQADFLKGDAESLSIDSRGELALGPATELVYESAAPFVWTVQGQADGTLYAGTGNEGQVIKIDPSGKASVFFDSPELEIHALAPAPNGGLFVGTSPDGRIYQVDRNGTSKPFFANDDKYIWALAVDGRGNLFAGTGDKGIVYKIAPDGKGTPFYKTNATHVTALAFDRAGNLLVGTSTPGRVLRVGPDGKGFVLLTPHSRKSARCGSTTRASSMRRPRAAALRRAPPARRPTPSARQRMSSGHRSRRCPPRLRRLRLSTSAAVRRRLLRARIDGRRKAPSIASRPTGSGTSCGNRATIRRMTWRSMRMARCSSGPGTKASCIASRESRFARRS